MGQRLSVHEILVGLSDDVKVYFEPPENLNMVYPCIVYQRERIRVNHADGKPYRLTDTYLVTLIERNPDSELPMELAALPKCVHDRTFTTNGLRHNVFKLSY